MDAFAFSPRRTGLIARVALIEVSRQRLLQLLVLGAAALLLGARALQEFNFGLSELKFIADFGRGSVVCFGSILTIVAGSQLFFSEIENRTALTLLAKPVRRAEFVVGKLLAMLGLMILFCGLMALLLAATLWSRETSLMQERPEFFAQGRQVRYLDLMAEGLAHWLGFGVLASLTLLIASFAQSSLYAMLVSFGVLIVCHLQDLAQEIHLKAGNWALRCLAGLIARVFPNFQVFSLGDLSRAEDGIGGMLLVRISVYALCYIVVIGALAVFSFKRREI